MRKLQQSIVMKPNVSEESSQSFQSDLAWSIDARLLWDILIYEKASRSSADADKSWFGDRIIFKPDCSEKDDVDQFAMVGCAGISGHKTVPAEVIADAPDDSGSPPLPDYSTTPTTVIQSGLDATDDSVFENLGDMSQFMDQSNMFLQEDFGKAIGSWINFNAP